MADSQAANKNKDAAALTRELLHSGQISQSAATRLLATLGSNDEQAAKATPHVQHEDFLTFIFSILRNSLTSLGTILAGMFVALQTRKKTAMSNSVGDESPVNTAGIGGIDALLSFESVAASLKPLFNEYIWWFVAMVLVISGSIMGIREAWLRFEGILRPLTMLFAFFTYHALFLGLGIFLYRRSAATGRMLIVLSALLVPVMFSIADSVTRQSAEAGAAATGVALVLALVTLLPISARLSVPYLSAVFYLPVPFALAALFPLAQQFPALAWVVIPAIAAAVLSGTGLATVQDSIARFVFASVGVFILLFILFSLNIPAVEDLARALRLLAVLAVLAQYAALMRALDLTRLRFFTAVEIVLYAIIALIAVAGSGIFTASIPVPAFSFRVLTLPLAIMIFLRAARHHNAAIHPLVFLTIVFCYAVTRFITTDRAWQIFAFFIFPLLIPWFSRGFHESKKRIFLYWATITGLVASLTQYALFPPHIAPALTGFLTAITIHRGAGFSRSAFHYLSVIGLMVGVSRLPLPPAFILNTAEVAFVLAIVYAIGGWYFEKHAGRAGETEGYPIDDLSLLSGIMAAIILTGPWSAAANEIAVIIAGRSVSPAAFTLIVLTGIFLNLRALRDQSLTVSLTGNLLAFMAIYNLFQPRDYSEGAAYLIAGALFFYATAAFFVKQTNTTPEAYGRIFLLRLKLPFNAGRSNNIAYGAALASLALLTLTLGAAMNWISAPDFDRRLLMLMAMVGVMILTGLIFHFRVFAALRLRGNVALLFVLLVAIGLTAVINRLGRPLPVDQVAIRLLLLFPAMALLTAMVKVYGPRYGKYLEAERHGVWYYLAPVTGVCALVLLELYEGLSVSRLDFDRTFYLVPPTVYLALALYPLVLAHTITPLFRHFFYLFLPLFISALFGTKSFMGVALIQNLGVWLPANFNGEVLAALQNFTLLLPADYTYLAFRQNIVMGVSGGVLLLAVFAVLSKRQGPAETFSRSLFGNSSGLVAHESGLWSLGYTVLIGLLSFQVAAIPPGIVLLVVALLYLFAANVRASAFVLFVAGLLVVHGGAHLTPQYPIWPGPALVALALLLLIPAKHIARRLDLSERFVSETAFAAGSLYIIAAHFYAATEGRAASALGAGLSILNANADFLLYGGYKQSAALVLTLLLSALWLRLSLNWFQNQARTALAFLSQIFLQGAAVAAVWLLLSRTMPPYTLLQSAPFVLPLLLVSQMVQTLRLKALSSSDDALFAGYATARDAAIILSGLVLVALAGDLQNPLPGAGLMTLVTLLLYLLLNLLAAFSSSHTRYVYVAQAAVAGIYYSVRPLLQINSPQTDAFILFGYAFALTGISVVAERGGVTLISEPTRRFAAFMPVCVALIIDNFRSLSAAFYSLVASSLYFLLSRIGERNLFAMLAAIALNAALFLAALASGFDSSEFYAFPAGLTIIFFATIFKGSLTPDNQARVRTIGGLIAYLPAALQVTLRSGLAQNPLYSVIFGAVCLAGILAGTVFRIRSYLFLGILFFTLDIIANLVQEGLQNQFVGFLLLTVTGLSLIAILIIYNLKKDAIHSYLHAWREKLALWR